jgi:CDGSH-type Zn-finger protein
MSSPTIAKRLPIPVDVEAGKDYYWCACGESKKQPFCDGSHKGTEFVPLKFTATETEKTFLCACKHTANAPFCDGTHGTL